MARSCRVGVHGRNDTEFYEADYIAIREAKIETLKMMSHTRPEHFQQLKILRPGLEFITRLYDGSHFSTQGHPTPEDFAQRMIPVMEQLQPYCTKFEIHNEPNHQDRIEGWGDQDDDARSFNTWFLRVYRLLKSRCPWAQLGFPGLAIPHRDLEWIELCRPAVELADWLGVHCYWQTPAGQERNHLTDFWGLRFKYYHEKFPTKIINLTEVGNSNVQNNIPFTEESHAREFTEYLAECFKYPYLNSASFFILSSPDPTWDGFTWRSENGRLHAVVQAIGEMARPALIPARSREPEITQMAPPGVYLQPVAPPAGQTSLLPALQTQTGQLQARLQQLQAESNRLLDQIRQLQSRWAASPPAIAAPAAAPPIQNITGRLKKHPNRQYPSRPLSWIDRIIIHHTAVSPTVGAERIARHRVDAQGWPGIGYHYFITGDGQIQQTNELTTIARHATDEYNPVSIGISFAGDFTHVAPSPAQIEAGAQLVAWLIRQLNLSPQAVFGFKELVITQSPGDQWDTGLKWGNRLRQKIQQYLRGTT